MTLPKIKSYGQYSSDNYGAHALCVEIGALDLYYSYQTLVAFSSPETGLVVHENIWGMTTGKHLNWILRDRSRRVSGQIFDAKWLTVQSLYFADPSLSPGQMAQVNEIAKVIKAIHPNGRT